MEKWTSMKVSGYYRSAEKKVATRSIFRTNIRHEFLVQDRNVDVQRETRPWESENSCSWRDKHANIFLIFHYCIICSRQILFVTSPLLSFVPFNAKTDKVFFKLWNIKLVICWQFIRNHKIIELSTLWLQILIIVIL